MNSILLLLEFSPTTKWILIQIHSLLLTPNFLLPYSLFVILLAIPFFLPLINLIPNLRRFLIILFSDHFIQHRIEII